jgi:hypothetical protein
MPSGFLMEPVSAGVRYQPLIFPVLPGLSTGRIPGERGYRDARSSIGQKREKPSVPSMTSNAGYNGNLPPRPGKIMNFRAIALHAEIRRRIVVRESPFLGKEQMIRVTQ